MSCVSRRGGRGVTLKRRPEEFDRPQNCEADLPRAYLSADGISKIGKTAHSLITTRKARNPTYVLLLIPRNNLFAGHRSTNIDVMTTQPANFPNGWAARNRKIPLTIRTSLPICVRERIELCYSPLPMRSNPHGFTSVSDERRDLHGSAVRKRN
jgi:hypothetical protein